MQDHESMNSPNVDAQIYKIQNDDEFNFNGASDLFSEQQLEGSHASRQPNRVSDIEKIQTYSNPSQFNKP